MLLSIGGAMFGMVYATVVALCCRLLGRRPRPRPHFWIAGLASLAVAYVGAEISLQQRELVSPFLLLALTVGLAFATALLVSDSRGTESTTSGSVTRR